tara:strand:+ start:307 stop:627 length:321 start_codon:yes stop_codon:yes gene_type:complete
MVTVAHGYKINHSGGPQRKAKCEFAQIQNTNAFTHTHKSAPMAPPADDPIIPAMAAHLIVRTTSARAVAGLVTAIGAPWSLSDARRLWMVGGSNPLFVSFTQLIHP